VTVERHETLSDSVSVRDPELLMAAQRRRVEHPHAVVVVRLDGRAAAAAPDHQSTRGHGQRQDHADEYQGRADDGHRGGQVDDGDGEREQHAAVERVDEALVVGAVEQPGALLGAARHVETVGEVERQRRPRRAVDVGAFRLASGRAGVLVVGGLDVDAGGGALSRGGVHDALHLERRRYVGTASPPLRRPVVRRRRLPVGRRK